nr:MAG TPA: hypothetical protein [Caudoviricetes sp.]DAU17139.1 MAG TPA: hypothetical protein [Caudoviricetes sp.]
MHYSFRESISTIIFFCNLFFKSTPNYKLIDIFQKLFLLYKNLACSCLIRRQNLYIIFYTARL